MHDSMLRGGELIEVQGNLRFDDGTIRIGDDASPSGFESPFESVLFVVLREDAADDAPAAS